MCKWIDFVIAAFFSSRPRATEFKCAFASRTHVVVWIMHQECCLLVGCMCRNVQGRAVRCDNIMCWLCAVKYTWAVKWLFFVHHVNWSATKKAAPEQTFALLRCSEGFAPQATFVTQAHDGGWATWQFFFQYDNSCSCRYTQVYRSFMFFWNRDKKKCTTA